MRDHQPAVPALVERLEFDQLACPPCRCDQVPSCQQLVSQGGEDRDLEVGETLPPPERPVAIALLRQRLPAPQRRGPLERSEPRRARLAERREGGGLELGGVNRVAR